MEILEGGNFSIF